MHHLIESRSHFALVFKIERHTLNIRFVGNLGRVNLHDHRKPDRRRHAGRLVSVLRHGNCRSGNSIVPQQRFRIDLGERRSLRLHGMLCKSVATLGGRGIIDQRDGAGRFMEKIPIERVTGEIHESANSLFRRGERGNAGLLERSHAVRHQDASHPGCQKRFLRRESDLSQSASGKRWICHGLWGQDRQNRIDFFVRQHDFHRVNKSLGVRVADNIHRISVEDQLSGRNRLSCCKVELESSAVDLRDPAENPLHDPGPPALVTMANRGPTGSGCRVNNAALSKTDGMSKTRTIPARSNAAW